jgi:hypothetical protein
MPRAGLNTCAAAYADILVHCSGIAMVLVGEYGVNRADIFTERLSALLAGCQSHFTISILAVCMGEVDLGTFFSEVVVLANIDPGNERLYLSLVQGCAGYLTHLASCASGCVGDQQFLRQRKYSNVLGRTTEKVENGQRHDCAAESLSSEN